MAHNHHFDMSELEREFELEMGDGSNSYEDRELEEEFENFMEGSEDEYEYEEDPSEGEYEYEQDALDGEYDQGYEYNGGNLSMSMGERFFELSQREFESEYEMDEALNEIFDDMEREYFFKKLFRAGKNFLKKNPLIKSLAGKALNMAAGFIPGGRIGLEAIKKFGKPLLSGLRQNWANVAKAGIGAIAPNATQAVTNFAEKMGVSVDNPEESNQEAFERMADGIRRSYEYAADQFNDRAMDPIMAGRLANRAFETGIAPVIGQKKPSYTPPVRKPGRPNNRRIVRLQARPGEEIDKIVIIIDRKA